MSSQILLWTLIFTNCTGQNVFVRTRWAHKINKLTSRHRTALKTIQRVFEEGKCRENYRIGMVTLSHDSLAFRSFTNLIYCDTSCMKKESNQSRLTEPNRNRFSLTVCFCFQINSFGQEHSPRLVAFRQPTGSFLTFHFYSLKFMSWCKADLSKKRILVFVWGLSM